MSIWKNEDGLTINYGPRTTYTGIAAKPSTAGEEQELVVELVGTELADSDTPDFMLRGAFIPAGSLLVSATIIVDDAFTSGGAATLDVGTYTRAGAAIDADGIDAAVALSALEADDVVDADGAQVGTVIASDAYVAATYNVAAYTAGTAKLIVRYIK